MNMILSILAQSNTNDAELLKQIILYVLGPGSGIAVQALMEWLIKELKDDGKEPSPKTKRRLAYLVSVLLPSALYGILVVLPLNYGYSIVTHILYVLSAFGISQFVHGERKLPNGSEVRTAEMLEKESVV